MLPLSIAALFISYILLRIGNNFTVSRVLSPNSWSHYLLVTIITNLFSAGFFVYVGTYIAPSYNRETAIVLTTLLCIVAGASLFIVNFINKAYISNVGIIAGIVGAVGGCIVILQSDDFAADLN